LEDELYNLNFGQENNMEDINLENEINNLNFEDPENNSNNISEDIDEITLPLKVNTELITSYFDDYKEPDDDIILEAEELQLESQLGELVDPLPVYSDTEVDFYDIDARKFKEIFENTSYNYEAMLALQYALNSILTASSPTAIPTLVKYYLKHLTRIGVNSAFGTVYSADLKEISGITAIKVAVENTNLTHELFIAIFGTNDLREFIPNFAWTYGGFKCTSPVDDGKSIISYCRDTGNKYDYLLLENIVSISMPEFIVNNTADEFINFYLQILYALHKANQSIDFTHYDLHIGNVLAKEYTHPQSILYDTESGQEWCNTKYIGMIIDFGRAHITFKDKSYGLYGYQKFGVLPDYSFPLFDAYKFLCFCLSVMQSTDRDKFNYVSPILSFFNITDTPDYILDNEYKYRYALPSNTALFNLNMLDLTKFIRARYPSTNFAKSPIGTVISCGDFNKCETENKILTDLQSSNYPKDIITLESYTLRMSDSQLIQKREYIIQLYYNFKPALVTEFDSYKTLFENNNTILVTVKFSRILMRTPVKRLIDMRFMDEYKNYLISVVNFSMAVNDYSDLIKTTDQIIKRAGIDDNILLSQIETLQKYRYRLAELHDSAKFDYEKIMNTDFGTQIYDDENIPEYVKIYYTTTLPKLIENI
jgi:hypothetical protein